MFHPQVLDPHLVGLELGAEADIRTQLLKRGYIKGIIGLRRSPRLPIPRTTTTSTSPATSTPLNEAISTNR